MNYEMKACGVVIKDPLQGPNFQFFIPIYRKSLLDNCMLCFLIHVLGKLICCPREFDNLILVVTVSIDKANKKLRICVLHVMWWLAF